MNIIDPANSSQHWDVIVIGSGFGSMFFLQSFIQARPNDKVLIVEMGNYRSHEWQLENQLNSSVPQSDVFVSENEKPWDFNIGLGGSSNCWWGLSPRLHPSDFSIHSDANVNVDWPLDYDDLIDYYQTAENIMSIAGPDELSRFFPGTGPYPMPPHRLTSAEEMIIGSGDPYQFAVPAAKASRPLENRNRCCSSSRCNLCPVNAKYTHLNGMSHIFSHPNVSICLNSRVTHIDTQADVATGIRFDHKGKTYKAKGDLIVNGANAIQAPFIMLRSGIDGYGVGRFLGEKMLVSVDVFLDGLDHFDGGTSTTGFNLALLENNSRKEYGASVFYFNNWIRPGFRLDPGRWRQIIPLSIYVEDIFDEDNGVFDEGNEVPTIRFKGFSEYARKGLEAAMDYLPTLLKPLPVEKINPPQINGTLGHVQGSLRMGSSGQNSVVDKNLIHHRIRNLVVVGSSVFPAAGSVNPTLTVAALSLRAADKLMSSEI